MLISVEQLHAALQQQEDIVVLDARFRLGKPEAGLEMYQKGHIPGAVYIDLEKELSKPASRPGGRHPLPEIDDLVACFAEKGIHQDCLIVVYDDNQGMAARAWWLLTYLGHQHVFLLDGGIDAWLRAGYPLRQGEEQKTRQTFTAMPMQGWTVDYEEVASLAEAGNGLFQLLDARDAVRFRGESEPIDAVAGHIPTAKNLPWTHFLHSDGTWKSPQEAKEIVASLQLSEDTPVIAYCGSGVTACSLIFALRRAGLRQIRLYPGSWSDYISHHNALVATGEKDENKYILP